MRPDVTAHQAGAGEPSPEIPARLLRVVAVMVEETRPGRVGRVSMSSHLERDLGLDSLARVELLLRVGSEFGKSLPEAALAEAETPQDLLRFIDRAGAERFAAIDPDLGISSGPISIPGQAETLVEVLEWHAERTPQRPHVLLYGGDQEGEFRADTITYRQLLDQARRVATGLVSRGLLPRQAVALMLPTGSDYLTSFFGVMLAGRHAGADLSAGAAGADRGSPAPARAHPGQRRRGVHHHRAASEGCGRAAARRGAVAARGADPGGTRQRTDDAALPGRRPTTSLSCNTPRAAPAIPRAWCSPTPTCWPTSAPWARPSRRTPRRRVRELAAAVSRHGPDRRLAWPPVLRHCRWC